MVCISAVFITGSSLGLVMREIFCHSSFCFFFFFCKKKKKAGLCAAARFGAQPSEARLLARRWRQLLPVGEGRDPVGGRLLRGAGRGYPGSPLFAAAIVIIHYNTNIPDVKTFLCELLAYKKLRRKAAALDNPQGFLFCYQQRPDCAALRAEIESRELRVAALTPESALYQFPIAAYNEYFSRVSR